MTTINTQFRAFTRALMRNRPIIDDKVADPDLTTRSVYPRELIDWERISQISLSYAGIKDARIDE